GGPLREGPGSAANRAQLPKEGGRPGLSLLLAYPALGERGVERRDELGPLPPAVSRERVTGAGVDDRLEHALVAEPQVDPLAQVYERGVGPAARTARDDGLDGPGTDVLDAPQPEPEPPVGDHGELEARLVH